MISINSVQEDLIVKLKADVPLVFLVSSAEVREAQWKGTLFKYPNVRVKMGKQAPLDGMDTCPIAKITFSVLCYSETASSKEADAISYTVCSALDQLPFTGTNMTFISIKCEGLIPAVAEDDRTWKSEAQFTALVKKK